jgi:eukaryotic-like serine/threonine-protein kinase
MTASTDPLVGKTLSGRFRILEPLGIGGMGKVYKAIQSPLDRMVALKVLNPRYGTDKDPGFERRFFLEAAMTAKLHHPNTITVHDYGRTDDGIFFIAMEYVEGETLLQVLQREGHISWQRAFHVGGQICRSLREAHKMGIVHRDLKPANVMVLHEETGTDMVKVLDFGLVKSFTPDGPLSPSEDMPGGLTQAGVLLGSPLYMAPEQARNELDPRSDVYSLGVLLYHCIAGRTPFQGKESIDIIVKHIREPPPMLAAPVGELPGAVTELVMKCLEKEPVARYQSMDEVLEALKAAGANSGYSGAFTDPRTASHSGASSKPSRSPSKVTPMVGETRAAATPQPITDSVEVSVSEMTEKTRRGRSAVIALGVVGGLAVGMGLAWWAVSRKVDPPPKPVVTVPPVVVTPPPVPGTSTAVTPPKPAAAQDEVRFNITSVPEGARVTMRGAVLGVTPLPHTVTVAHGAKASVELTFTLDGYQSRTETYEADAPGRDVEAKLTKAKGGKPKKVPGVQQPPGYKDDPYK